MPSMFNATDVQHVIDRINHLTPESKAMWGKMTVSQMLAHIQEPMKLLLGERELKRGLIGFLFGGIAKKQLLSGKPFKQNLPTDKTFIVRDNRNFEEEKEKVIHLLHAIQQRGAGAVTTGAHPFFGKMSPGEWDSLGVKHLDHHLRQFGV